MGPPRPGSSLHHQCHINQRAGRAVCSDHSAFCRHSHGCSSCAASLMETALAVMEVEGVGQGGGGLNDATCL